MTGGGVDNDGHVTSDTVLEGRSDVLGPDVRVVIGVDQGAVDRVLQSTHRVSVPAKVNPGLCTTTHIDVGSVLLAVLIGVRSHGRVNEVLLEEQLRDARVWSAWSVETKHDDIAAHLSSVKQASRHRGQGTVLVGSGVLKYVQVNVGGSAGAV